MGSSPASSMETNNGTTGQRPHVALLAFPFGTHAAPLHTLAAALAADAPHATFSFLSTAGSNAGLAAAGSAPPNLKLYDVDDGNPANDSTAKSQNPAEEKVEIFLRLTPGNFREAMQEAVRRSGGAPISCVVSDCFLSFAGDLAAEMGVGVPWVAFWACSPRGLLAHLNTDFLRETFQTEEPGEAQLDEDLGFLPGMAGIRLRDLPYGIVAGDRGSVVSRLLHQMSRELPRASAVAINDFVGLDAAGLGDLDAKLKKCLFLAPLSLLFPPPMPDSTGCLKWLDSKPSGQVAYIAFGSMVTPPPAELLELAEGLENSGVHFIWSLKHKFWDLLPAGFLRRMASRGLVVEWAPQPQVLKHPAVGAFVTHCGWSSLLESLAGGVPMICRPFFGDQTTIGRCISHVWEIGLELENGTMTKEGVASALHTLLGTAAGQNMKERVSDIRAAALRLVQPGGSSSEALRTLIQLVSSR